MSKKSQTPEEKQADGKKSSKAADKKQTKNKIASAAKKLADKQALEIAAELPAGQGNAFLQLFSEYKKSIEAVRAASKVKTGVRNKLKAIKVDMSAFDRVFKLSEMDAADVAAKKTTEALYEKQLGLVLSDEQKKIVNDVEVKRENAKAAMAELNGGDAGEEVGSGTNTDQKPEQQAAAPAVPERNENIGAGFRPHAATH